MLGKLVEKFLPSVWKIPRLELGMKLILKAYIVFLTNTVNAIIK